MGYTERWKERKLGRSINDKGVIAYTAERVWDVDSVASELEAIDAVPDAVLGSGHPQSNQLQVSGQSGTEERKGLWAVRAQYTTAPPTDGTYSKEPDLLFGWEEGNESFQADTDVFGNPLVNSALDPFEGGMPHEVPTGFYTVEIIEPYFDARKAAGYRGRVFDDELVTPFGTFGPLETKCVSIRPVQKVLPKQNRIMIAYRIEVRLKSEWPEMPSTMSPFDFSFVDQGTHGWGNDGKAHNIVSPVFPFDLKSARLNGKGIPFDANDAILQNRTATEEIEVPAGASIQDRSKCKVLYYFARKRTQSSGLHLPTHT